MPPQFILVGPALAIDVSRVVLFFIKPVFMPMQSGIMARYEDGTERMLAVYETRQQAEEALANWVAAINDDSD